jgi:pyridoxine kinase
MIVPLIGRCRGRHALSHPSFDHELRIVRSQRGEKDVHRFFRACVVFRGRSLFRSGNSATLRCMTIISIQSQVAYGHVGNSAAVFPMQLHGIDVVAVPTTLLSNRPGYPTIRGRVLETELVADLLRGIEERGAIERAGMILSGYLGSAEIAGVVADFVARAKARNPGLRYALDPVLGDRDRGLFVRDGIPPLVRDRLLPLADIITPNHFEFEALCGGAAVTLDQVIAQAHGLIARGPETVVITSAELSGTPADEIETLAIERSRAARVRTPRVPISPNGTGDLFAALFASARVRGSDTADALAHAASGMFAVLERTAARGTEEMRIVESADALVTPKRRFEAVAIS